MRGLLGISLLFTVLGALPAAAHGDVLLASGDVMVAAGESISFHGELHYHRLAARVAADGPLIVRLVDDRSDAVVFESAPASNHRINHLIRCCDDAVWTPHTLTITNPNSQTVSGRIGASLVHDDLAVMAYRAESGIVESVVVMAVIWGWIVWRILRRRHTTVAFRRALWWSGGVVGTVAALGISGGLRYGTSGAPGFLAGLADVPLIPANPIVSRASLLMGAAMVVWAVAASYWARARAVTPVTRWTLLGLGLVGTVAVTVALMARSYGAVGIPLAMGLVAGLPLLAVMAVERARPRQITRGARVAPERERA